MSADFTAHYQDPLPVGLPSGSSATTTSFDFQGGTQLTGIGAAFGIDPNTPQGKYTLRPIGLTSFPHGLVFNIAIDQEDVIAATFAPVQVADSIASFLLYLNATGPTILPIGVVVNTTIDVDSADLTPGGTVAGSFSSDLAAWVPHPVPEPGSTPLMASGLTALMILARRRAKRS